MNAAEEGRRQWIDAGRPAVPSLVVDGEPHPVLHVSQLAKLLRLAAPAAGSPAEEGAAALGILDAWLGHIGRASWDALLLPTPSRGRSLRNLTVNVFHPFELLPGAWASGEFPWRTEEDGAREAGLGDRDVLLAWADAAAAGWRSFLERENVAAYDPVVTSPKGEMPFAALVAFQHWHAVYHYRQLLHVLGRGGDDRLLDGPALPRDVF